MLENPTSHIPLFRSSHTFKTCSRFLRITSKECTYTPYVKREHHSTEWADLPRTHLNIRQLFNRANSEKRTGKVLPMNARKAYGSSVELHSFLTLTIYEEYWWASRLARFTPKKNSPGNLLNRKMGRLQSRSTHFGELKNLMPLSGLELRFLDRKTRSLLTTLTTFTSVIPASSNKTWNTHRLETEKYTDTKINLSRVCST